MLRNDQFLRVLPFLAILTIFLNPFFVNALGQKRTISFEKVDGGISLVAQGQTAALLLDGNDWPGVIRAAKDLAEDFNRVTGHSLTLTLGNTTTASSTKSKTAIIVGTIGKSTLINKLITAGKLDVSNTTGKWESFQTQVVQNPLPGYTSALVISGSDKRGSIFGIYDLSEQIGVSPWYFWADVPTTRHSSVYALDVLRVQGPPSVKYRGIFLNDEQPALTNWVNENFPPGKYGPGYNHEFYSLVFELLLRLRANFLWPTMWDSMFGVDDAENQATADMYGIVMSTSHTEPLMRSTKEWNTLGNGTWSYATNEENIKEYWREGVERGKDFENYWTVGMRGNGDNILSENVVTDLLEKVVADQREILSDVLGVDVETVPQVWCLYKDIQSYYEEGMRVPDDVTLLWADDNWGNLRRAPVSNETDRVGGAGIYYHFDFVGDPRDYKWINTMQLQKVWEQMNIAYQKNARQIWVVNVGDLKPLELPIDYFMSLAYDFDTWGPVDKVYSWEQAWASREFGSELGPEIASIIDTYGKFAGRRKFELVDPSTYNIINYREADTVLAAWKDLSARAEAVYDKLSHNVKPAFFQLVSYPVKAAYIVHDIHISSAKNNLYANQRRNSANSLANYVMERFKDDHKLTEQYHKLLDGKWNHMASQTHLGYQYWQQPMRNTLPPLAWTQLLENSLAGSLGVSIESSNGSIPGDDRYNTVSYGNNTLVLPVLDPFSSTQTRWIEVFSKGTDSFNFTIKPHNPWVKVNPSSGYINSQSKDITDVRVEVSVDWAAAPEGYNIAFIDIFSSASYGNFGAPSVNLPINKTSIPSSFTNGFVESNKYISIEAEHTSRNTSTADAAYQTIPQLGRTLSGVALTPILAPTQTPPDSPRLEYDLYVFTTPAYNANITLYLGPALNMDPYRPLKYAIALDDAAPQVVRFVPDARPLDMPAGWEKAVEDAVWMSVTNHTVASAGKHTLKIWAVEPGVVFQKVVVDLGGVKPSYLGPPESVRV
ncbi:hypothetical protein P167DRAFT_601596 [Morchella conica CCBAS932]|uniref:Gylcosyl hydrolase 115 C-terminal domain-containing protein n=1 Tax=Morchella conica CCBAS932 TaxID=1392247 RepID=A0A3N4L4I7_9PEZI|nr:hypothetical protein P167DRAFT_601596 [Morchella conica CCBAS932]